MSRRLFWISLAVLAAVRLLLMATMPVFEPSEARYAAISANMARTGDFIVPRFTHNLEYQSFDGKPPLVFQAGGVFCRALGVNEKNVGSSAALQFGVRLFPFLSAALVLWILFSVVRKRSGEDAARLAVVICATCVAFFAAAGISMTDMTLSAAVAGALLLYGSEKRLSWKCQIAIVTLLSAGFLTKGPIAIALFGLPVFVDAIVNRNWKKFLDWRWLALAPLFVAIVAPWFVLMEREVPGSTRYFFYNENFLRFVKHDYGDRYGAGREAFRGVAVLWMLVVTLPWMLVPVWKVAVAFKRSRAAAVDCIRSGFSKDFSLIALLSIVGFWCLTSRVLLYYLFPVIPLFAAFLAEKGDRALLSKCVKPALAIAVVVLTGALVGGMITSDKMQGAKTEFNPQCNHYANEFYQGTKPASFLKECRDRRDAWLRYVEENIKRKGMQK